MATEPHRNDKAASRGALMCVDVCCGVLWLCCGSVVVVVVIVIVVVERYKRIIIVRWADLSDFFR